MSLQADSGAALSLLERLQDRLQKDGDVSNHEDLATLIYMLDSPLFKQLLNIQDAIVQLKRVQKQRTVNPDDFEIDVNSGELVLHGQEQEEGEEEWDGAVPQDSSKYGTADTTTTVSSAESVPLGSSAASNDDAFQKAIKKAAGGRQVEVIDLHKPEGCSLGFSVVGLKSEHRGELGIFVQQIQPGNIAAQDGRLCENDHILAIDGSLLDAQIRHQQAISILQRARGRVQLVIARGPVPPDHPNKSPNAPAPAQDSPRTAAATANTSSLSDNTDTDYSDMLSTEWTQIEVIDLMNDGSGLGFGIIGGKSTGVVVKTILPGGVADRDARLRSGDHLIHIGNVNVRGLGSEQVATVLRQSGAHVRLIVARCVAEEPPPQTGSSLYAPIIPTHQLDEHLHTIHTMMTALSNPPAQGEQEDQQVIHTLNPEFFAQLQQHAWDSHRDHEMPEVDVFEVELVKDKSGLGITIAGYVNGTDEHRQHHDDDMAGIFVRSIAEGSAADLDGRVQINDQIIEVDNKLLDGYNNVEAVEALRNTGKVVRLKLARYNHGEQYERLQHYLMQSMQLQQQQEEEQRANSEAAAAAAGDMVTGPDDVHLMSLMDDYSGDLSPDVEDALIQHWMTQVPEGHIIVVAQLSKFREGGGLGIGLEGTVDVENGVEVRPHHYIRSVLPEGPVGQNGNLQSGDELLEVNGKRLIGLDHVAVVDILKTLPQNVRIVCSRRITTSPPSPNAQNFLPYTAAAAEASQQLPQSAVFPHHHHHQQHSSGSGNSSMDSSHLIKSKSEQALSQTSSTHHPSSSSSPADPSMSRLKSRSLEPLGSLAMWSEEPYTIELIKGDEGLGFSILDYQDQINPAETVIVIRSLVPGGVAHHDGRLVPGDRLVFVNEVDLENATLEQAVQALKGAPHGPVLIGVAKPLPLPEMGESSTDDFDVPDSMEAALPSHSAMYSQHPRPLQIIPGSSASPAQVSPRGGGSGLDEGEGSINMETMHELDALEMDLEEEEDSSPSNSPHPFSQPLPLMEPLPPLAIMQQSHGSVSSPTSDLTTAAAAAPISPRSWSSGASSPAHAVTALAETTIRIKKGNEQLGLTVESVELGGGVSGCVVKSIQAGGAVAKDGRISVGDVLLAVNNESLRRITSTQARAILRRASLLGIDISITYLPVAEAAAISSGREHMTSPSAAYSSSSPPPPRPSSQLSPK